MCPAVLSVRAAGVVLSSACSSLCESDCCLASPRFQALELSGGDVKALFRRAQAYEGDGEPEKAFQDVVNCTKLDPKVRS